ncbi:MAG: hypothetical protein ACREPD_15650 [Stenotrophomonas sp.]|uniref:hypothetical protein n=1 Tax=Gammaproteobacteria TaxID=1236 RepID=UPI003D6D8BFD
MSLIPTVYKSTDPGAPLLSGQPGALAILLDALLVDGYGTGANQKLGMGWTRAFTGSNVRVFRNNSIVATGFFLRLDDTAQRSALLRGFATMSDIDTGTDPTPATSLKPTGSRWDKSSLATSEGRAWVAVGNERFFYLFIDTSGQFAQNGGGAMHPHYAGDITSLKPGDRHHYVVSYKGSDTEMSSSIGYSLKGQSSWSISNTSDTGTACFIGRNTAAVPGAVRCAVSADGMYNAGSFGNATIYPPYPYAANNGLLYAPIVVFEGSYLPRGFLPGLYAPIHRRPFPEMTVVSDIGGLPAGTQLLAKGYIVDTTGYSDSYHGQVLIDIANAW